MAVSLSDVLRTAKSLTTSMRQRDIVVETNRRLARAVLSRMEASLEPDANTDKMSSSSRGLTISDPLPDLIEHCPQYRGLYEDNQKLYVIVAEQQLTLELIMEKYRAKIAESTQGARGSFLHAQACLDKNDGILGALLHEKGVILQTMGQAVWEDDLDEAAVAQHEAEITADNATLKEVVRASLRMNGLSYLTVNSTERGNQTSPPPPSLEDVVVLSDQPPWCSIIKVYLFGRSSLSSDALQWLIGFLSCFAISFLRIPSCPFGLCPLRIRASSPCNLFSLHAERFLRRLWFS